MAKEVLTTKDKAKILNGKRYKIITKSIEKQKANGDNVSYELEIDLHYAWYLTINSLKG